jgi:hypothetical protein
MMSTKQFDVRTYLPKILLIEIICYCSNGDCFVCGKAKQNILMLSVWIIAICIVFVILFDCLGDNFYNIYYGCVNKQIHQNTTIFMVFKLVNFHEILFLFSFVRL